MRILLALFVLAMSSAVFAQTPLIEPGVSQELARWRAARYSDIRYKLNLTLEKMSPVLKGTIEIRVQVASPADAATAFPPGAMGGTIVRPDSPQPIILDWRKLRGNELLSKISNVTVNGKPAVIVSTQAVITGSGGRVPFEESNEHLIFRDGIVAGENVIKLDFTSPILTSGSAITRYIDKEDGSEYIYSLFVPSDASMAFPVFDQPDLKARFTLSLTVPKDWNPVSNTDYFAMTRTHCPDTSSAECQFTYEFGESLPISTYVFAFGAGPFKVFGYQRFTDFFETQHSGTRAKSVLFRRGDVPENRSVYVRASQATKFQPHAAETFRLMREGVKYLEGYFDYKFPWPKYDLVLIPEFPFGGMEHAGATFVREQSIIFPTEPTKSDYINRATLIFHETAHQWFGDTVTMKWFDDLWLKEGFANFMAYKAMEKIMPEMNAWKIFYERIKQPAYATDSTKGTTPIYQPIKNLSAAKSAYGNIVYNKAPAFLRQAEFYLGEDKFQTAVRAFLKKHEYANATWEDLVKEFEAASGQDLKEWASEWVRERGLSLMLPGRKNVHVGNPPSSAFVEYYLRQQGLLDEKEVRQIKTNVLLRFGAREDVVPVLTGDEGRIGQYWTCCGPAPQNNQKTPDFVFPNYQDYGYGIFILDDTSRDYVLKNVGSEKDPFLRSMMYGALWDSVREGELDPTAYIELAIKNLAPTDPVGIVAPGQPPAVVERMRRSFNRCWPMS